MDPKFPHTVTAAEVEQDLVDGLEEALRNRYQPHPVSAGIAIQIFEKGIDSLSEKQLRVFNEHVVPEIENDCRLLCGCLPGMDVIPSDGCKLCCYFTQHCSDHLDGLR